MTMSAACSTGYVSSPWLMSSGWFSRFSLYVGVRSSQLTGVTVVSSQASSVCSGRWLWTNSMQRVGVEAQRQQRGRHLAGPRRGARPGRGGSSARGSRRCSRSRRTRPAAGRSCGSRRGRCRGAAHPEGWMPREDPRARGAASGRATGPGPVSVVIGGECSRRPVAPRHVARRASATIRRDVATQSTPERLSPRAAARRRCSAPGRSAAAVVAARCSTERGRELPCRPTAPGSELVGSPSATSAPGASRRGCRPTSLTDAPAHLVADGGHRRRRRAHGRRRAGPHADRRGPGDGQAGRDRQQARDRPPRAGARGHRAADRRGAALRGRGRRRDPGPRPARRATSPRIASAASAAS